MGAKLIVRPLLCLLGEEIHIGGAQGHTNEAGGKDGMKERMIAILVKLSIPVSGHSAPEGGEDYGRAQCEPSEVSSTFVHIASTRHQ